jgi:hypothetical protein
MTATFKVLAGELRCETAPGRKKIDKSCLDDFWNEIGGGNKRGVYVFGYRSSRGWKPLYVGRTKKQNFRTRINQHIKYRVFVKSCGRVLPQNEGEMPVDSGFMCLGRCSEFARESEMIPSDNGLRCRGADAGYFNEATAFA